MTTQLSEGDIATNTLSPPSPQRGIFCNRTLNLRSIKAIGYDMDYTLIHYRVDEWERRAYEHIRQKLVDQGWPVGDLQFDPARVVRGLIIDTELGNILKANRFGYVKRGVHGTQALDYDIQRKLYSRTIIDLGDPRFQFMNTLFSLSEAWMYAQLVDLLDARKLPEVLGYHDLYRMVRTSLDETHMEGLLKAEIMDDPDRYVELDADVPLALLDQHYAGKKLLLITNSEWHYTQAMMAYAFDRFLPHGTWQKLFDLVIVSARKPAFFSTPSPWFQVVNDDGLLKPCLRGPEGFGNYLGGNAADVEEYLGLSGDQILYVGDHVYSDVQASKNVLRWRTALIVRELEEEITSTTQFEIRQQELTALMAEKQRLELAQSHLRILLQRKRHGYGPQPSESIQELENSLAGLRKLLTALDDKVSPLAIAAGRIGSEWWGPLMRAGNDKSHMARQVERHADIYMSRVANFLSHTPFFYLRAPRGNLPHDREDARYVTAPDEEPLE